MRNHANIGAGFASSDKFDYIELGAAPRGRPFCLSRLVEVGAGRVGRGQRLRSKRALLTQRMERGLLSSQP